MNLNAPRQITFIISLILAVLALVGHFVLVPFITEYQFWVAIAGYAVLTAGCVLKGV